MRTASDIKADLLSALDAVGDEQFLRLAFKRRKGSFSYTRTLNSAEQVIVFAADYLPTYQRDKEIHLHPTMCLGMGVVTDAAMELVGGNKMLLANAPEIIVNQPIEFAAPKSEHVRWFASGFNEMRDHICEIGAFVKRWVVPVLDEFGVPGDLIKVYNNRDNRIMKQPHWYIFVAAAHLVNGNPGEARSVIEDNLGAPGLRKRYATAFEALRVKY